MPAAPARDQIHQTPRSPLPDTALDRIFREARTFYSWEDRDIPEETIRELYDLVKWGPTSANQSPARFLFLHSKAAKDRLKPHLMETNVEKTMTAPWTVVVAWDWKFHEKMPQLFPHNPATKDWFEAEDARFDNGFRNGTLQGAYLLIAARALGLDTGPMSGFDKAGVDREFFHGDQEMQHWRSNFLVNLGYGTTDKLFARLPRFTFDEAAAIL